ncbi:hypothetical protein BDP27DRAFT_1325699, partial [Rhodocollybia butyracea]
TFSRIVSWTLKAWIPRILICTLPLKPPTTNSTQNSSPKAATMTFPTPPLTESDYTLESI